jgi:hypothetical protein
MVFTIMEEVVAKIVNGVVKSITGKTTSTTKRKRIANNDASY